MSLTALVTNDRRSTTLASFRAGALENVAPCGAMWRRVAPRELVPRASRLPQAAGAAQGGTTGAEPRIPGAVRRARRSGPPLRCEPGLSHSACGNRHGNGPWVTSPAEGNAYASESFGPPARAPAPTPGAPPARPAQQNPTHPLAREAKLIPNIPSPQGQANPGTDAPCPRPPPFERRVGRRHALCHRVAGAAAPRAGNADVTGRVPRAVATPMTGGRRRPEGAGAALHR